MEPDARNFPAAATAALGDAVLKDALGRLKVNLTGARAAARERLPEFDRMRAAASDIRAGAVAGLAGHLERFEANVLAAGGHVHWCETAEDARRVVIGICRAAGAGTVTKGKSMVSEEIALNDALEAAGMTPVETDLGQYILQLAHEPPSHIVLPAIHMTGSQVTDLFHRHHQAHGFDRPERDPEGLLAQARQVLRQRFLAADVGITGANFLIAETGQTLIVTNEGNGDLTQTLPKVHIVVATIEKVVPTLADVAVLLRVLARSATGQDMTSYVTLSHGPRRAGDLDGPAEFHVVLLDNGRSALAGSAREEVLRCIRCAACMNHCPVYGAVGGQAYGWVYPGPIGAALSPHLIGLAETRHLPAASTLCGRCAEVCPVGIDLPKLLRGWREEIWRQRLTGVAKGWRVRILVWVLARPWAYRLAGRLLRLGGWRLQRVAPRPQGGSFQARWRAGER